MPALLRSWMCLLIGGIASGAIAANADRAPMSARMDASGRVMRSAGLANISASKTPSPAGSVPTWVALGPDGADVADVRASPTAAGVVLAGVAPSGSGGGTLFRSADDGATWATVSAFANASVHRLAFGSDGVAWAAAQNNVWKSTDDGQTWAELDYGFSNPNNETFAVTVDPSNPAVVWTGITSAGGFQTINVMRSADGGSSWVDRTPPLDAALSCDGIAVDPLDPDTVIAVFSGDFGGGEVWVTTDGGDTWTNRSDGLPANPLNAVDYDGRRLLVGGGQNFGSEDVGLFESDDLGVTWNALHDASWTSLVVTSIAVDPADSQTILVATDGAGVNRSTDGGATWAVDVAGSTGLAAQSVSFVPTSPGDVFIGVSSLAILKSTDAGLDFQPSSDGISLLNLFSIAANPLDPNEIAVAFQGENSGGVFSSVDGGVSWHLEAVPATRYSKVGFAPDGTLYAISSGPSSVAPEGLYRRASDDTWIGLGPDQGPNFESNLDTMQFSVNDPDLIYLGGADFGGAGFGSTVWRSPDAGQTWTKVFLGDTNDMVTDIEIGADGTDQRVVAVYDGFTDGQQGGAIRSVDGGLTWSLALTGLTHYSKLPRLCQTPGPSPAIFLSAAINASHGKVYRSDDVGATWAATSPTGPVIADIACDPLDAQVIYLAQAGADTVVRSTDAGVSFSPWDTLGSVGTPSELVAVVDDGATRLFLSTSTGTYATPAAAPSDVIFADGFDG